MFIYGTEVFTVVLTRRDPCLYRPGRADAYRLIGEEFSRYLRSLKTLYPDISLPSPNCARLFSQEGGSVSRLLQE